MQDGADITEREGAVGRDRGERGDREGTKMKKIDEREIVDMGLRARCE